MLYLIQLVPGSVFFFKLEYEQKQGEKARKEVEILEKKLRDEQERHKSMVLFLVNERKQMLFEVHELKIQNGHGNFIS